MVNEQKKIFNTFALGKGLRSTRQREIILDCFLKTRQHVSAEDLYLEIKATDPTIGYATIYRTLKLFVEAGLANQVMLDRQTRYEHIMPGEHHDHLICTGCNAIIEFENQSIEKLQDEIAACHGFYIKSHKLEIYGLCAKCRGAASSL